MKKKKYLKIFAAGGLALFMGIGTLCGVLISPMNSPHATTPGATQANANTQSGVSAGQNASGAATATSEAIQLDPETDETIYTTESGIEIKSHNVSATGTTTSIQYFTLGSYNGTPVNWLIVGASSAGVVSESSTPAGAAIVADQSKQQLVTGATSSSLAVNQILCVSQYAFPGTYNPNYTAHARVSLWFSYSQYGTRYFSSTTDDFFDYYASYTAPTHVANSLTLGTTLGINGYYGSGSGKIVTNSTFSSNYVFSLTSSHYTTFVGATNYKTPYLFTATSTATNIWAGNSSVAGTVTSTGSYTNVGTFTTVYAVTGSGAAYAYVANSVSSAGAVANTTIANFTATFSPLTQSLSGQHSYTENVTYNSFHTDYSVTNSSISIGYRPAFILQL